ncbi:hypothetical protein GWI33_000035 [Rhynchophorus ferrugineus]|uniref:Uncharacterized protein n=1 Tax=Rhynchophorus ferrugineus TaxID=354439 RepID=A0A834IX20_RHYFE|nr:hypothetical protein GWI33_000035 [Rhynchophorus ferrugineus]
MSEIERKNKQISVGRQSTLIRADDVGRTIERYATTEYGTCSSGAYFDALNIESFLLKWINKDLGPSGLDSHVRRQKRIDNVIAILLIIAVAFGINLNVYSRIVDL